MRFFKTFCLQELINPLGAITASIHFPRVVKKKYLTHRNIAFMCKKENKKKYIPFT